MLKWASSWFNSNHFLCINIQTWMSQKNLILQKLRAPQGHLSLEEWWTLSVPDYRQKLRTPWGWPISWWWCMRHHASYASHTLNMCSMHQKTPPSPSHTDGLLAHSILPGHSPWLSPKMMWLWKKTKSINGSRTFMIKVLEEPSLQRGKPPLKCFVSAEPRKT